MLIKKPDDIKSSEITAERTYLNRRNFIKAGILAGSALATGTIYRLANQPPPEIADLAEIETANQSAAPNNFSVDDSPTLYKDVTSYNNYYEFGTSKSDPARAAASLTVRPWTIAVDGLVNKPKTFDLDELLRFEQQERTYRFRCVEGWSMVIPWIGFPLKTLLDAVEPLGAARYAAFQTVFRPSEIPYQRNRFGFGASDDKTFSSAEENGVLDFPYVEGLRLDEAAHPLTILATGLYGKVLPNQNGAPVRLVVPWKYGFKSIKSIVKITLTDREPPTTWNLANPREYGFYSNVNPNVRHPRWSQASEQRIGEFSRRETLMFNGYAEQVAALYQGLDLRKNF